MSIKVSSNGSNESNEEINRAEKLASAIAELDIFFYRASHDLRTPIVALEGVYNMLNADKEFSKSPAMGLLKKQVLKIKGLNESIIDVGKVRSKSLDIQPLNLFEITSKICRVLLAEELVKLSIEIQPNIFINTDQELLETILLSLVHNALNYRDTNKEPSVSISTIEQRGALILVVNDNGLGINEMMMPKLFEMFFRANAQKTGFGLSLYKSKLAAQRLGLSLEIESTEFEGTSASILFPEFFQSV